MSKSKLPTVPPSQVSCLLREYERALSGKVTTPPDAPSFPSSELETVRPPSGVTAGVAAKAASMSSEAVTADLSQDPRAEVV